MPGKELIPRPLAQPPAVPQALPWTAGKREHVTAAKWLYRRRHWTLPVAAFPAVWLAGLALHAFHFAWYALIAGLVLTAVTVLFGGLKWDRASEHAYAALTAIGLTLWLPLAAVYGPASTGWLGVPWWTVLLAAGTITWGIAWWLHKRPRGMRRRQKRAAKWDAWWQSHCWHWNLGGSKVADVHEMGVTTKVRVHGVAGRQSIQHVNQVMHLIESGLDGYADIGLVRAEAVKGHPNWFDFYFKKDNPLREPVEYDPALAPGSVHESFAQGRTETGNWKMLPLRCNRFVIGESRSGKSNDLLIGLAALTACPDDWQILIDLKGGRSARPVLETAAAGYVVTDLDEARMTLRMLVAEARARSMLAYDGNEQLLSTEDCPGLHALIDEVHGLTSVANGDAECANLLALLASLGMGLEEYVWVYTQYGALEESVRTEQTRGNLPYRTVYRVAEPRHASYAISEWNKLDASKLEEQGTCYTQDGPKAIPEQIRAPKMPHPLLRKITAQNARMVSRPPLSLYCGAQTAYTDSDGREVTWQEWWDARWSRLDPAFHAISPQYQAHMASSPALAFAAQPPPPEPAPAPVPGEGSGAATAARFAAELAGVPDVNPPKVNLAPVITRQKGAFASALSTARAPDGISPSQLMEESGMSERWVYGMLRALVNDGAVTQPGRGRYLAVPDADIGAAMASVDARNAQSYRDARAKVVTLR